MKPVRGVFLASSRTRWQARSAAVALCLAPLLGVGCASPGHPAPPSLQVPRPATNLSVTRVGDDVDLRWTTPARTTDGVAVMPPITAEICRNANAAAANAIRTQSSCAVVRTVTVQSGPSEATDTLPPALARGPAALLTYQVQLRGALGKTAGPGAAAFIASGPPPQAISGLRVSDTKTGALLEWTAAPAPAESVEITRRLVQSDATGSHATTHPGVQTPPQTGGSRNINGPRNPFGPRPGGTNEAGAGVTRLSAGATDAGGTLDRTAQLGAIYEYTAQRVRTVTLGGRTLELRSAPAQPVRVTMRDVFPPNPPAGLVASAGPGSIDLSWEPGTEARIAGYRVYRTEGTDATGQPNWIQLTRELLPLPSYRDLTAAPGHTYRYRVTATDTAGHESAPSGEAQETLTQ